MLGWGGFCCRGAVSVEGFFGFWCFLLLCFVWVVRGELTSLFKVDLNVFEFEGCSMANSL